MDKYCKDCGKTLHYNTKRCWKCHVTFSRQNPENNPNYKDGRTLKQNHCVDCGIKISTYYFKRCKSCSRKGKLNYLYNKKIKPYIKKKISKTLKKLYKNKNNHPMFNTKRSCETKDKLRIKALRRFSNKHNHPMFGKHWSSLSKEKIRNSNYHKNLHGENNPFYGKHHSLETRNKISLSHWGIFKPFQNNEYGPEFDSALKEQVRFRDKYKCRKCGCTQLENGKQLDVHHIDYNKKNNIITNLVSLCVRCHRKTNTNREYWKEFFVNIIKKIYQKVIA